MSGVPLRRSDPLPMKLPKSIRDKRAAGTAPGEVDAGDSVLFRSLIGPVRAVPGQDTAMLTTERPAPRALQFERDEAAVRAELLDNRFDPGSIEVGDEIHYLKSGQPKRLLVQLRRGQFSIRSELDLHEMTVAVARTAIAGFLDEAIRHGEHCVRIVHGKGLRSDARGPVLKRLTEQMLRRRGDVLAFSSALPAQGGTGAVLVLLAGR